MNLLNLDTAIKLTEKKVQLLKELKQSLIYESCKLNLVEHKEGFVSFYSLIEIESENLLCFGQLKRINSFLNRRNIDKKTIYSTKNIF